MSGSQMAELEEIRALIHRCCDAVACNDHEALEWARPTETYLNQPKLSDPEN